MKKKLLMGILSLLILTSTIPASVQAGSSISLKTPSSQEIQPRKNLTSYKYKTINGKRYKRLWSYTYNRWEEPNWTPA